MANILIIDDDRLLCRMLSRFIIKMGHEVTCAFLLGEAFRQLSSMSFDVVLLDVSLPDGNGLEALPAIRQSDSLPEVIILTGEGDPDGAEMAIKSGAWTYLIKPPSMEDLRLHLVRALQYREERTKAKPLLVLNRDGITGSSPELEECLNLVAKVANSHINVLLTGETGTGKEVFARMIHSNSPSSNKNFVVVDCAALPETLVESMLFGHEKGAFTGAEKARAGFIKEADQGTLFLDEVGELPLSVQKDFLRLLQEQRFKPLGSNKEITSDFRLVSATNRDLEKMVESGQFRKDLFFRLQSATIELPALRSRPQDIKELAIHYIVDFCERYGMETKGVSHEFLDALVDYDWPGNVRELIHTVERTITVARFEPTLYAYHLPMKIRVHLARNSVRNDKEKEEDSGSHLFSNQLLPPLQKVRDESMSKVERQYLENLMLLTHRDIKESCRIAALSQSRLYYLLKKHGIDLS